MSKKKKNTEPPVIEYKGRFVCRFGTYYRVKANPNDSYSLHHGSFDSPIAAKSFIDYMEQQNHEGAQHD